MNSLEVLVSWKYKDQTLSIMHFTSDMLLIECVVQIEIRYCWSQDQQFAQCRKSYP